MVKLKGNAMTQKYYTERLLPRYVTALQQARLNGPSSPSGTPDWILQEDGDPSHGHRKEGLASAARAANWVPILEHPPQSPDLNPQEGCWNVLKQRVQRRGYNNLKEFKQVIQEEWSAITMEQVRARIAEMPNRCKMLVKTGGQAIRSGKW